MANDTEPVPARTTAFEQVTVKLTARSAQALTDASALTGDSRTDTINRALQLYAFFEKIVSEGGGIYVRASGTNELESLRFS